jgi:hypothetical protein
MTSLLTETPTVAYKVADMTLADWGGKKSPSPSSRCPV